MSSEVWRAVCLRLRNRLLFLPNWSSLNASIASVGALLGRLLFATQEKRLLDFSEDLEKALY
jgi:hypothetical protein